MAKKRDWKTFVEYHGIETLSRRPLSSYQMTDLEKKGWYFAGDFHGSISQVTYGDERHARRVKDYIMLNMCTSTNHVVFVEQKLTYVQTQLNRHWAT